MSPGKWLYGILNITCGPDDENPLPLCNDHARIADLKIALDCEVKLKGFGRESKGQTSNLILFSDIQKEYEKMIVMCSGKTRQSSGKTMTKTF